MNEDSHHSHHTLLSHIHVYTLYTTQRRKNTYIYYMQLYKVSMGRRIMGYCYVTISKEEKDGTVGHWGEMHHFMCKRPDSLCGFITYIPALERVIVKYVSFSSLPISGPILFTMSKPIPITVFTGFLGSGTFCRHERSTRSCMSQWLFL